MRRSRARAYPSLGARGRCPCRWTGAPLPGRAGSRLTVGTVTLVCVKERGRIPVATNRKARHLYVVLDTVEAGIVLAGNEVKSLRLRRASLGEAFATVDDHEIWLHNLHIAEYAFGTWTNHAVRRKRKLLLHRAQIVKWEQTVRESGLSMVPLSLYFSDGRVKVELALVRGKKTWDRRHDLAERDARRDIERALSNHIKRRR
jgi:SsrA-binding protein